VQRCVGFPWDEAPSHLIRDCDGAFGPTYIRRDRLDHVMVFDEAHWHRVLETYASYYNKVRTHLSSEQNAPEFRRALPVGDIAAIPTLGGLHHQYVRV
jgi:hypothetical protein